MVGLACNVGLLPTAIGPSFLGKKVRTGLIATQFGSACVQSMPCLPENMLAAGRAISDKLWQTDIIIIK